MNTKQILGLPGAQQNGFGTLKKTYRHMTYKRFCTSFFNFLTILWLTDTFSILWLTDTFYITSCDLQTHFPFCDLQTHLDNVKSGATAKYLWLNRFCTVDPMEDKYVTRTYLEKKIILKTMIKWTIATITSPTVRVTWDAFFSETQRCLAYYWFDNQKFYIFEP